MVREKKEFKVVWTRKAMTSLKNICSYIAKDSNEAAKKVKAGIQIKAYALRYFPEKFPREELLDGVIGNYRFAVKWSYKIVYEVDKDRVVILLIINTRQSPQAIQRKLKA